MQKKISYFFNSLLDLVFSANCVGCKKKGPILCELCLLRIKHTDRERATGISAVFDYRDPIIKSAIWELKYKGKKHIAQILGETLYEYMMEELSDLHELAKGQQIIIVPIPLSKHRMHERGYNQAHLIAKYFALQAPAGMCELLTDILQKIKDTPPQARLTNRKKRLENISGAFSLNPKFDVDSLRGRTIIVIDDVTTTGGTLTEAMKILKSAGAKKVVAFAVAH